MMRRIMGGRVRAAASVVALALILSGCSGGDDSSGPGPQKNGGTGKPTASAAPSLGLLSPMSLKNGAARIELVALNRTSARAVTGKFKIINDGRQPLDVGGAVGIASKVTPGVPSRFSASGIGLLDGRAGKLYMPLQETNADKCLCSELLGRPVPPSASLEIFAIFPAPPADVRQVTVVVPSAVPFRDVPLGSGPVAPTADQKVNPETAALKPPRVLDVISIAEGQEQSVDEDPNNRSVRLSSDVLFAVDKADLNAAAERLLQQVAKQIDASRGTEVKVDGHADNTGNDAINQPLSERRAQTVADRLKQLATRQGVTYKAAGHGSKQPVAPNTDENGRRKNRRVTVTFARPAPPPPPATGSPGQGQGGQQVLGSADFTAPAAKGLKAEVNSLSRDASGLTTLVWTLRNTGTSDVQLVNKLDKSYPVHGAFPPGRLFATGGVMLFDGSAKLRYEPMHDSSGACLCSVVSGDHVKSSIGPNENVVFWAMYKLAPELTTVEVDYPWDKEKDAVVTGVAIK